MGESSVRGRNTKVKFVLATEAMAVTILMHNLMNNSTKY